MNITKRGSIVFFTLLLLSSLDYSQQISRPKRRDPNTCQANRTTNMSAKAFVQGANSSHKVVVYSKSYCPYCKKAKAALASLGIDESQIQIFELDHRPDGDAIQDALLEITGRRSVPQVFINGKFFGGGDETAAAVKDGSLKKLLQAEGLLA